MVVPDHNLVRRVLRVGTAPDKCQNIAPEQHLHHSDPRSAAAVIAAEVAAEDLAEGIAVVDPEPVVGAGGEAAMVLVKREVEQRRSGQTGWVSAWRN